MATTTRILDANVNGTVYTANLNDALDAIDTCHSGATAPTDEVANGKLWLDTSTTPGILKIYNNATWEVVHSGTVDINGGTINGAVIGGTTPAAITGTTLTATGAFTSLGIDDNATSTAMTLDSSGNVGIGRSPSSGYKLDIEANNQRSRLLGTTGYVVSEITNNGGSFSLGKENSSGGGFMPTTGAYDSVLVSQGSVNMVFGTNNTERMRIDSSGNVGIGTTNPTEKLHVSGTVKATAFVGDGSGLTGISAIPAGTVIFHAANSAPTGYLKANGAAVSRSTYSALFAAIGTTYGAGNGSTTFNVPDLRGEFLRGWDDARGVDSGRGFGSAQADEFESHNHIGGYARASGYPYANSSRYGSTVSGVGRPSESSTSDYNLAFAYTSTEGGSETRPRNIALLACIKY